MLNFKKGAFVGLHSIKPMTFKYFSKIEVSHGMIPLIASIGFLFLNPYITMKIKECPVFKPNEYFW